MTSHIGFTQPPPTKKSAQRKSGEARRIEELGKLNDRYMLYLAAGDAGKLQELAAEYAGRGMTATARGIELEVDGATCACKLPGLSANDPANCPTCGKPHRH
jgi:hypothetical protein